MEIARETSLVFILLLRLSSVFYEDKQKIHILKHMENIVIPICYWPAGIIVKNR